MKRSPPRLRPVFTCVASAGGLLLGGSAAYAQATASPGQIGAPAQGRPTAGPVAPDIVVTGTPRAATSSIDRKTYNVASDLQSAGGSISDVLRNLPSVDVDAQGNVSLRGDGNVQVLIDGKPSTSVNGANRAETLQALPADGIEKIEIITNPSARFRPDGAAGIINIVTKRTRRSGLTGTARASAGSDGRFTVSGSLGYRGGPWTVATNASVRRDVPRRPLSDDRIRIDPVSGQQTRSRQDSLFTGTRYVGMIGATIDYDLSKKDRVTLAGSYSDRRGSPRIDQSNSVSDATGAVTRAFTRTGRGDEDETSNEVSAKYTHTFAGDGHSFSLDLRRGQTVENQFRSFTNAYSVPAGLVMIDTQRPRANERQYEATAEYEAPLAGGKWLLGYDLDRELADYRNRGFVVDPATSNQTVDPAVTNRFLYARTTHAGYTTYERLLAKRLTALLGLRLEATTTRGDQIDIARVDRDQYFRAYPTAHLQYDLNTGQSVRASYSQRVNRPEAEDVNPYPVFSDPLNIRAGNPALRPEQVQSFELGYQRERGSLSLDATAFLHTTTNAFTEVSRFISPTVLLSTRDNLGRSTATGLDFSSNGSVTPKLKVRASGTVSRNEIDATNLGFVNTRTGVTWNGKSTLEWTPRKADLVQLAVNYRGRRLTPQGHRLSSIAADFGARHNFASGLTAVFTVTDVFDSQREHTVIDTPLLIERSTRRGSRRTASLTLFKSFGGRRKVDDAPIEFQE